MDFSTGYTSCQLCCYLQTLKPLGRNALSYAHVYCNYIQKSRRYILRERACLRPLVVPPPRQSPQAVTHHFLSSPSLCKAGLPALQSAGPTQATDTKKALVDVLKLWAGRCNLNIENTATKNINRSYLRLLKTDFFFLPSDWDLPNMLLQAPLWCS